MDNKKMMITAGVIAGVGYGMYKYFRKKLQEKYFLFIFLYYISKKIKSL